jgi:hypothetical protein
VQELLVRVGALRGQVEQPWIERRPSTEDHDGLFFGSVFELCFLKDACKDFPGDEMAVASCQIIGYEYNDGK